MTRFEEQADEATIFEMVKAGIVEHGLRPYARLLDVPVGVLRSVEAGRDTTFKNLKLLAEALGLAIYIGPPSELPESREHKATQGRPRFSPSTTLPRRGFAKCGVRGWGKEQPLNDPLPAPDALNDTEAFYVTATGQSMVPEGIRSGDTVLITRARAPKVGDRVWIIGHNGEASIKRLTELTDTTAKVRGWLPAQDGQQKSFEEELIAKHLRALAPVIAVFQGRPGQDNVILRPDPKADVRSDTPDKMELGDFAIVEMHPLQRAFNGGAVLDDKSVLPGLAFPRAWLKRQGILASHASLLAMDGDDMEPTFGRTSVALINHRRTTIQPRRCYAFLQDDVMHIKRLEKLSESQLLVTSDNPKYRSVLLYGEQLDQVEIVGEVVWAGQSF